MKIRTTVMKSHVMADHLVRKKIYAISRKSAIGLFEHINNNNFESYNNSLEIIISDLRSSSSPQMFGGPPHDNS